MSETFKTPQGEVEYTFNDVQALVNNLKVQFTRNYDRKGTSFYNPTDVKVISICEQLNYPIEIIINVLIEEAIMSHPSALQSSKLKCVAKLAAIKDYKKLLLLVESTIDKFYGAF